MFNKIKQRLIEILGTEALVPAFILVAEFIAMTGLVIWFCFAFASVVQAAGPDIDQKDAAKEVCLRRGYRGDSCYQDLLAIARTETHFDCNAVGKAGERGCFQIMPFHRVELENALDFKWAAKWTLIRLERYGYPEYRTWAIQCHNGCNKTYLYAKKVIQAASIF